MIASYTVCRRFVARCPLAPRPLSTSEFEYLKPFDSEDVQTLGLGPSAPAASSLRLGREENRSPAPRFVKNDDPVGPFVNKLKSTELSARKSQFLQNAGPS
jgi:hypothetical protein